MTNFLAKLRAQQQGNQNAQASKADASINVSDSPTDGTHETPESAVGIPAAGSEDAHRIEGSAGATPDSAQPATEAPRPSFISRLARNLPARETSIMDSNSESEPSILGDSGGDTPGGDEGEVREGNDSDSSGNGDAPVNAATVVEVAGEEPNGQASESLFRTRLAALDELCQSTSGITPLIHDTVKAHIRGIMEDLRDNPEMRGLLLDKDMHNIMLFIQSSTQVQQNKVEKVAKKRDNKAKTTAISSAFDDAFAALDNVPSLSQLGGQNTDSIETKVR